MQPFLTQTLKFWSGKSQSGWAWLLLCLFVYFIFPNRRMTLNPQYETIGKSFVQQYYMMFDDPLQRANLANLYSVSLWNMHAPNWGFGCHFSEMKFWNPYFNIKQISLWLSWISDNANIYSGFSPRPQNKGINWSQLSTAFPVTLKSFISENFYISTCQ